MTTRSIIPQEPEAAGAAPSSDPLLPDPGPGPHALFLDLDGTLIDIALDPDGAQAPPGLVPTIARLHRALDGALAIISGRPIAVIDALLAPLRLPAAGVHGAELRRGGTPSGQPLAGNLDAETIARIAAAASRIAGVRVEMKRFAVAVHYRSADVTRGDIETMLAPIISGRPALELRYGRKVVEVMPSFVSKAGALTSFMQEPPFKNRRPVMIGDDATDEGAIEVARAMAGSGYRVAGEHFQPAESEFAGARHVRSWLAAWLQRMEA